MLPDDDTCYEAMVARDGRFDGRFYVGVLTTGVYCRPVCPARTPLRRNVRFFATAAAAAAAGLRACKRCRPDSLPGSRHWDHRSDLVGRALRLIASGAADEPGVGAMASQLGVSDRHLRRQMEAELGVSPIQLARTRRAQTARMLLEQTPLAVTEVAFTAGFRSVRQFNDVMLAEFGAAPTQLRRSRSEPAGREPVEPAEISLRLRMREPYDGAGTLSWLRRHAVPGVDEVRDSCVRTTCLDGTAVELSLAPGAAVVRLRAPESADLAWLPARVALLRQWLDLDANPEAVADVLHRSAELRPLVSARPGVRVVGSPDPFRALVCAILAQQVSVAAAATHAARLAAFFGPQEMGASQVETPPAAPVGGRAPSAPAARGGTGARTWAAVRPQRAARFPAAQDLAAVDPDELAPHLGIPRAKARTLVAAAAAVADGVVSLSAAADRDQVSTALLAIRGIGAWTVADVRMRALADPDVWPAGDLVLRRETAPGGRADGLSPAAVVPWRSYAAHHIWVSVAAARAAARSDKRGSIDGGPTGGDRATVTPAPRARGRGDPGQGRAVARAVTAETRHETVHRQGESP